MRKRKLLSLLVLLMTAVTGAWAQDADYDIFVDFEPYYNHMQTHFLCMITNPTEPGAEIKGTLNLSVDGDLKGSFDVNGEMVDGDIPALDAGDHTWSAVFYPEGGGSFNRNRNFTIDKAYTNIYYYGSTSIDLGVGESTELDVYIFPDGAGELSYSSSDASVASITKNEYSYNTYIIQAKAAGTATITFSFAGSTNYYAADEDITINVTVEPAGPTVVASGDCGTDVTYSLTDDGTLTISGTGAMADYSYDGSDAPWYSQRWDITSVVIGDGVTTIGASAFCDCDNLTSVSTSTSVTSIGYKAFYECEHLASVSISSGVTSIGNNAFYGCGTSAAAMTVTISGSSLTTVGISAFQNSNIESITLPASVTSIGQNAFAYCSNLATVTLDSNPFIDEGAFYDIKDGATVTMNLTAKSAGGAYWTTFFNREYGFQADEDTQVFKAELSGTGITLHEVTDKIVEVSTPVILKSTGNPVMTLTTASSSNTDANSLQGVARPEGWGADGMYVLNNGSKGVGFYKLASGKTLGVGKAFLSYGSPDAPAFFLFSDDNMTTGIASMHNAQCIMHNDVFDLQGRRINNAQCTMHNAQLKKGLYIVNGKKVFINK